MDVIIGGYGSLASISEQYLSNLGPYNVEFQSGEPPTPSA